MGSVSSVLWNHHGELILPACLSATEDQLRHTEPTLRLAVVCRRRHGEEIICRGIAFRLLCDRIGMTWALILSAVIFGFAHIFNDGATVWSALAIAVTSGWLLGVAYVYHQSLWAPIGMHWAWNYLEGYVFGCPVSGAFIQHPIIMSRLIGPTWLTGGSFGPEASVIAILIGVAISLYYTLKLKQKRHDQIIA